MLNRNNPTVHIRVSKPDTKRTPAAPIQQQQSQISEGDGADQHQQHLLRKQAEQQQLQMD